MILLDSRNSKISVFFKNYFEPIEKRASVGIDGKKRKNWHSHELEQKIAHKRLINCAAFKDTRDTSTVPILCVLY